MSTIYEPFLSKGEEKMGLLDGFREVLDPIDLKCIAWDAENFIVMSRLINSTETDSGQGYIFFFTAKDLWEAVKLTYSKMGNIA